MRTKWTVTYDEASGGKPSVGFLQVESGGPCQIFLTLNGWDFAWIAFFREAEKAKSVVDSMADTLPRLSQDRSSEGLIRYGHYLEEITAQSEFPIPEMMQLEIQEDLRIRHAEESGWRANWSFEEAPLRYLNSIMLGVMRIQHLDAFGIWITFDAGNTFAWVALYHQEMNAHWEKFALEEAIHRGAFATAESAGQLLSQTTQASDFPVPAIVEEQIEAELRKQVEATAQQDWKAPEYKIDLSLFQFFYEQNKQQIKTVMQSMQQAKHTETYDPYFLHEIGSKQRMYCLDHTSIIYLKPSALKLCDTMLTPSPDEPDFPIEEPLWFQPLAPLSFRKGLVRGIFIYDMYNVDRLERLNFRDQKEKERAKRYIERKHGMYQVEIFFDNPNNKTRFWQGKTFLFGEYDINLHSWARIPEGYECPVSRCTIESLGDREILLQCEDCQQEFDYWTRWLKTIFWVIEGKFRSVEDTQPFEERELTLNEMQGKVLQGKQHKKIKDKKPRVFHATVVQYDASYFKPSRRRGQRGSLRDTHIILTTEEALREGAMDVDLDGVLIRDFGPRRAHKRYPTHPRFKTTEISVKAKPDMPQLISLRTWKARQQQRAEALHKQEVIYASTYEAQKEEDNDV